MPCCIVRLASDSPDDGWVYPTVATTYISGGRSGDTYFKDFIAAVEGLCLPPVDPSFIGVLGPIIMIPWDQPGYEDEDFYTLHAVTGEVDVYCASGYHFEPPSLDTDVTLSCMSNGMWMDPDAMTIRRCVKNKLSCDWPLDDLGALYCEPAIPVLQDLIVSTGAWQVPSIIVPPSSTCRYGPSSVGVCVVPLSDVGRISMALFSPLIAFGLLAVILMMQLAARTAISLGPQVGGAAWCIAGCSFHLSPTIGQERPPQPKVTVI